MILSTLVLITILAALINGMAVAGALRFMWGSGSGSPPSPALTGLFTDDATLNAQLRGESWVDLATLDAPMVRSSAPRRPDAPQLSWGDHGLTDDDEADSLLRELMEA